MRGAIGCRNLLIRHLGLTRATIDVVPRYPNMSDITYSALIFIVSVQVQFTKFDFSSLILISVIQYRKLLQHIGSIFQNYSFSFTIEFCTQVYEIFVTLYFIIQIDSIDYFNSLGPRSHPRLWGMFLQIRILLE